MLTSELPDDGVSRALVAPALPASLEDVHALIASLWARCADVSDLDRLRFESAVIEVVGNVIEHSVPLHGEQTVTLEGGLACTPEALHAHLADDAAEVRTEQLPSDMPDADMESGRGLAIARTLADRLEYRRDGEHNRWLVVCDRS